MKRWLFLIALGVGGGLLLRQVAFEGIYIASPSMEPTLPVGAHYFVNKVAPLYRKPKRLEVVVFTSPIDGKKGLVKRVIGLPGETLEIKNKQVFVDAHPMDEPYAVFKRKDEILVGDNIPALQIPEDSYFVMGDNRDESGDSRDWKDPSGKPMYFVTEKQIQGILIDPVPGES